MNAGALNKRVTIERRTVLKAPSGQKVEDWAPIATVWAGVKCTEAKAVDSEGVIRHETIARVTIRYRTDLSGDLRVKLGERTFSVTAPPVDWKTEQQGLTLICKEIL